MGSATLPASQCENAVSCQDKAVSTAGVTGGWGRPLRECCPEAANTDQRCRVAQAEKLRATPPPFPSCPRDAPEPDVKGLESIKGTGFGALVLLSILTGSVTLGKSEPHFPHL